jgi:hypothetical protein
MTVANQLRQKIDIFWFTEDTHRSTDLSGHLGTQWLQPSLRVGSHPYRQLRRRDLTRNRFGCDETQAKGDVPSGGSTDMNAVRDFGLMVAYKATVTTQTRAPVLRPRNVERPSLEDVMADTEKRFPKTLAYLAKWFRSLFGLLLKTSIR